MRPMKSQTSSPGPTHPVPQVADGGEVAPSLPSALERIAVLKAQATLTVAEAVIVTGCSDKVIRRMIKNGLRTVRIPGTDTRISTRHLMAIIDGEEVAA